MSKSGNLLRTISCSLALSAACLLAVLPEAQAQAGKKVFGGKVLESHAPENWFLMKGGASKKYARVRINVDKKTRWSGVPLKGQPLKEGDPVQVTGVPAADGAFRALTVEVLDPKAQPGGNAAKGTGFGGK